MEDNITGLTRRVFSISDRTCPSQPSGGPGGVNYRLLLANRKYDYIENMYHIFNDTIIDNNSILKISLLGVDNSNEGVRLTHYFKKLDEFYHFSKDDCYFFHDVLSAYIFISCFPVNNTVLVYHQQGSLYKEWEYFTGENNPERKKYLDSLLISTMKSVMYMAFPSKGSIESIISSEPALEEIINNLKTKILYNGCDRVDNLIPSTDNIEDLLNKLKSSRIPNFVTAATLNEAKGVERIPEFLSSYRKNYGEFLWVVVGDGIKADELEQNIKKYDIQDNTIWIRSQVPHDDMLAIFQFTDFYILTHRFSIFDFSTIEAMGYGNIPILTPVGGNKEVIVDNNGVLLHSLSDTTDFDDFIANQDLDEAKKKNIRIAEELFSEKTFLKGYAALVSEINKDY